MALLNSSFLDGLVFRPDEPYGIKGYLVQSADKKTVSVSLYWIMEDVTYYRWDGKITIKSGSDILWEYTSDGLGSGSRPIAWLKSNGTQEKAVEYDGTPPAASFTLPEGCTSITVVTDRIRTDRAHAVAWNSSTNYLSLQFLNQTFAVEPYYNDEVEIYTGSGYEKYKVQINDGSWSDYKSEVWTGTEWALC